MDSNMQNGGRPTGKNDVKSVERAITMIFLGCTEIEGHLMQPE
jgi:hypothetical protein